MNLPSEVLRLNDLGYGVHFLQDSYLKGWHAKIFFVNRQAPDGRWFATGEGRSLEDALASAMLDLTKPAYVPERRPIVSREVGPPSKLEDLI